MKVEDQFLNKTKFSKLVEKAVGDLKISYMDAILYICEKNDIEPEDVKKFVSPIIITVILCYNKSYIAIQRKIQCHSKI